MKTFIYSFFITLMLLFSASVFSQPGNPPPPPNGGTPIGSGIAVLLCLSAAYGGKKVYKLYKNKD
jgi:hypothetical protein